MTTVTQIKSEQQTFWLHHLTEKVIFVVRLTTQATAMVIYNMSTN